MWTTLAKKSTKFAIASLLIAALYAVYGISCQLGVDRLQQEAGRYLEQVARELFAPIDKYSYLPELIARQPAIAAILQDNDSPLSISQGNAHLESIKQMSKVEAIHLMDRQGLTIASSNRHDAPDLTGQDDPLHSYFQEVVHGGTDGLHVHGTTSKTPGYYLAYPVKAEGEIIGAVVIKIDLSNVDGEWRENLAYEVTVTDEQGVNFLSSVPNWKYRPMQELSPALLDYVRQTRQYDGSLMPPLAVSKRHIRGENSLYLTIPVPHDSRQRPLDQSYVVKTGALSWSAWNVNVFMPADQVHGEAMRNTLIAAAFMLAALSIGFYWNELLRRIAEREKAKLAIEAEYAELKEKHRQLEALSMELNRLAFMDDLTGSYNRRFFYEIATKMLSTVIRHKLPLFIVLIDIDFFKRINDEYGHHAGDKVLKEISRICSSDLREGDIFARLGGEEFVMALMPISEKGAIDVAERLRRNVMNHRFMDGDRPIKITISCGVAQFHPSDASIEGTIQRADKALYEAKKSGRNQIAVANPGEREPAAGA